MTGKVKCQLAISLDGFVAGPNQSHVGALFLKQERVLEAPGVVHLPHRVLR